MTVIKTITTGIKGLYFAGEIEDKGADSKFVLRKFPATELPKVPVLSLEDIEVMISEMNEIKNTLKGVIPPTPVQISLVGSDSEKLAEYAGASEAVSNLNLTIEGNVYKLSGEGKVVSQFEWFYGDNNEYDDGIYVALEFTPPSSIEDVSNAKFKGKHLDGSEKISDFDGLLVQLINANNINTGRTMEIAWDGENFTEVINLDFSGVTGLTV